MARRTKSRKRKYLGNRSYGGGNVKNRRGKGNKGGKGRAGMRTHKIFFKMKTESLHKPKGFFNPTRDRLPIVRLADVVRRIEKDGQTTLNLGRVKVIGRGDFPFKADVTAAAFSAGARGSIEKAGGSAKTLGSA